MAVFTGNVAAIDFGTFCSLSYQVSGWDRSILRIHDTYDSVLSALLVKKEGATIEVVDIGYSAQSQYKMLPKTKYKEYLYFECFKMQLRDENVNICIIIFCAVLYVYADSPV